MNSNNTAAKADPKKEDIEFILKLLKLTKYKDLENEITKQFIKYPKSSVLFNILGASCNGQNKLEEAIKNYRESIKINPNYAQAYNNLGAALHKLNKINEAIKNYERAVELDSTLAQAFNNLGHAYHDTGDNEKSLHNFKKVIEINPKDAQAHNSIGLALHNLKMFDEALLKYKKAIEIKNDYEKAYNNLGNLLSNLGKYDEATEFYKKAIIIKPDYALAYSNLLFNLNYNINFDNQNYLTEAKKFPINCKSIKKKILLNYQYLKKPKKLRIGFVSSDFGNHPGGLFTLSTLKELKKRNFELICYSTKDRKDDFARSFRSVFLKWNSVEDKSDEEFVKLIFEDKIHILVDVQGHSANNRLAIFIYKAAPIQISWGAQGSTGINEMDYFIGTPIIIPKEEEENYVEKILRLPDVTHCYTEPDFDVEIKPLPYIKNKFITFGCVNKSVKINDTVIDLWSKILSSTPSSKILLKNKDFDDKKIFENFLLKFEKKNINRNRVILQGESKTRKELLEVYNSIDIGLDPFPFQGNTSTCEAVWMGVPVLTLKGNRYLFHFGENINFNLNMPDWTAKNYQEYIDKAVNFSVNVSDLSKIRMSLRQKALKSPLFDTNKFVINFSNTLWKVWRDYDA
jgi:protein O-GlcNAc transferase